MRSKSEGNLGEPLGKEIRKDLGKGKVRCQGPTSHTGTRPLSGDYSIVLSLWPPVCGEGRQENLVSSLEKKFGKTSGKAG